MNRFKPGDVVTVRSDLEIYGHYSMESGAVDSFVPAMACYAGKSVTIKESSSKYRIMEMGCNWTDEMFEEYFDPLLDVTFQRSDINDIF